MANPTRLIDQVLRLALALLCTLSASPLKAQAITEAQLRAPWEQHLLVLQSMSTTIAAAAGEERRAALADRLARLQVGLGEYETQVDQVIDRVIADPQYAYIADKTSHELSVQLGDVHARFAAFYSASAAGERPDVQAAQAALDELRRILAGKSAFERDMLTALGSGSRQLIVELATRWWKGEEQAIAVKKLVGELRQKVEDAPLK
jgi:hypothetical protein